MIFKIYKGSHRPPLLQWLSQLGLFFNSVMARRVYFYQDNKYDLPGIEDDEDVNKLFGFGFLPGHQKNSARAGWWYNTDINKIVLMAYCYVAGKRIIKKIAELMFYKEYNIFIYNQPDRYLFIVKNNKFETIADTFVPHSGRKKIGYKLGLFFGGNNPAPNDMTIKLKKI